MENIDELKKEIAILNKRISALERKENTRKALNYIKIIIKILLILAFAYAIWRGYQFVVNDVPNLIEERVKSINPFSNS